ncbi:MAG: hypothetical protein HKO56_02540, partial [Bacteroidia bacterium]|nr:hypothetical protein [Bacteroidia bacterium]NNM15510.1 hypothetical protein [Bacteroidia bacterium]
IERLENKKDEISTSLLSVYTSEIEKIRILKNELIKHLNNLENGNPVEIEKANDAFNESAIIFKESAIKLNIIIEENNKLQKT